jgi:hypothetical protein
MSTPYVCLCLIKYGQLTNIQIMYTIHYIYLIFLTKNMGIYLNTNELKQWRTQGQNSGGGKKLYD